MTDSRHHGSRPNPYEAFGGDQSAQPVGVDPSGPATNYRYLILGITTVCSVLLYLDRVCIAEVLKLQNVMRELSLTDAQRDWALSAFFLPYALAQVPTGWLSDRFGARTMLTLYVVAWSLFTVLTGFCHGFWMLIVVRCLFGAAQAGAYPTAGGLLRRWMPISVRGIASSVVAMGGRIGGAIAPVLTAFLIDSTRNWRGVMTLYAGLGCAVAIAFWFLFRNRPQEHPYCNLAEQALIEPPRHEVSSPTEDASAEARGDAASQRALDSSQSRADRRHGSGTVAGRVLSSVSMWLMCLSQFTTNIGWVYVITKLPTYLNEVHQVPTVQGGFMVSIVLTVGIGGMLLGGVVTDVGRVKLGLRWGRCLPLAGSRFAAAAAYIATLFLDDPWLVVACLSLMAFSTDLGVAATWAYMQDVGGRYVAAMLGWANMWGNVGAFLSAPLLGWVLRTWDNNHDWHEAAWVMAGSFMVSGIASLGIDATKKLDEDLQLSGKALT